MMKFRRTARKGSYSVNPPCLEESGEVAAPIQEEKGKYTLTNRESLNFQKSTINTLRSSIRRSLQRLKKKRDKLLESKEKIARETEKPGKYEISLQYRRSKNRSSDLIKDKVYPIERAKSAIDMTGMQKLERNKPFYSQMQLNTKMTDMEECECTLGADADDECMDDPDDEDVEDVELDGALDDAEDHPDEEEREEEKGMMENQVVNDPESGEDEDIPIDADDEDIKNSEDPETFNTAAKGSTDDVSTSDDESTEVESVKMGEPCEHDKSTKVVEKALSDIKKVEELHFNKKEPRGPLAELYRNDVSSSRLTLEKIIVHNEIEDDRTECTEDSFATDSTETLDQQPAEEKKRKSTYVSDVDKPKSPALVVHKRTAAREAELSINVGDIVFLHRRLSADWYYGERHGVMGLIPANYIKILSYGDEAAEKVRAVAKTRYRGRTDRELSVEAGQLVYIIHRLDFYWYIGHSLGEVGLVPAAFLDVLSSTQDGGLPPVPVWFDKRESKYLEIDGGDVEVTSEQEKMMMMSRERSRDWGREQSRERSNGLNVERSRGLHVERSRERNRERSKERSRERSKDRIRGKHRRSKRRGKTEVIAEVHPRREMVFI